MVTINGKKVDEGVDRTLKNINEDNAFFDGKMDVDLDDLEAERALDPTGDGISDIVDWVYWNAGQTGDNFIGIEEWSRLARTVDKMFSERRFRIASYWLSDERLDDPEVGGLVYNEDAIEKNITDFVKTCRRFELDKGQIRDILFKIERHVATTYVPDEHSWGFGKMLKGMPEFVAELYKQGRRGDELVAEVESFVAMSGDHYDSALSWVSSQLAKGHRVEEVKTLLQKILRGYGKSSAYVFELIDRGVSLETINERTAGMDEAAKYLYLCIAADRPELLVSADTGPIEFYEAIEEIHGDKLKDLDSSLMRCVDGKGADIARISMCAIANGFMHREIEGRFPLVKALFVTKFPAVEEAIRERRNIKAEECYYFSFRKSDGVLLDAARSDASLAESADEVVAVLKSDAFDSFLDLAEMKGLTYRNVISAAVACVHHIKKYRNGELTEANIKEAVRLSAESLPAFMQFELLNEETTLITLTDMEDGYYNSEVEELAAECGVHKANIMPPLRGGKDKGAFLDMIKNSVGKTTIVYAGHGYAENLFDYSGRASIYYKEFADALIASNNIENICIVLDTCWGYDFAGNLIRYLDEMGVEDRPVIITAANRGQESTRVGLYDDPALINALHVVHAAGTPLRGADFLRAEGTVQSARIDPAAFVSTEAMVDGVRFYADLF